MSLTLNPLKVYEPIPYYLSQARGINRVQRYEEQSYKWHEDFISRAEDRRRRLNKSLSQSQGWGNLHFSLQRLRLTLQLDTVSLVFLLSAAALHNADLIFWALISLPMGLPLLATSTGNKLDLCLGLEECAADVSCMTRQLTLHAVFPQLMLGLCVACMCVCVCVWLWKHTLKEFNLNLPRWSHKPNDDALTVYHGVTLTSPQSHWVQWAFSWSGFSESLFISRLGSAVSSIV